MRVLKVVFAVVGSLATLLAIATVGMAVVFYTPGGSGRAVWGSALYFGIAVACFYAFYRIKRAAGSAGRRGFDVVVGERGDAAAGR
jgi:hypothetical protein